MMMELVIIGYAALGFALLLAGGEVKKYKQAFEFGVESELRARRLLMEVAKGGLCSLCEFWVIEAKGLGRACKLGMFCEKGKTCSHFASNGEYKAYRPMVHCTAECDYSVRGVCIASDAFMGKDGVCDTKIKKFGPKPKR